MSTILNSHCRCQTERQRVKHSQGLSFTTLADVLIMVPPFMETLVEAWDHRGDGIRALRLVCVDLARAAPSAVQACSVQIGQGAYPDACQWIQLISKAEVQEMDVIILIQAGKSRVLAIAQLDVTIQAKSLCDLFAGIHAIYSHPEIQHMVPRERERPFMQPPTLSQLGLFLAT